MNRGYCCSSPWCEEDQVCRCDQYAEHEELQKKLGAFKHELYEVYSDTVIAYTDWSKDEQGQIIKSGFFTLPDGTQPKSGDIIFPNPHGKKMRLDLRCNSLIPKLRIFPKCECPKPFTYFVVKYVDGQTPPKVRQQSASRYIDMRKVQKEKEMSSH